MAEKINTPVKMPNIALIGCSSAGKSTIVRLLAELSGGVAIGLDAENADGRSLASLAKPNPKEFMEGDPIREKMMQEAKEANRRKKPFFIDDAFVDIIQYLNKRTTKIVLIIPTIGRIIKNVKARNLKAATAGQERFAANVLNQLRDFLEYIEPERVEKLNKTTQSLITWICPKDIYTAIELDKMFYDKQDWDKWETILLRNLHNFGFGINDLKSKTKYKAFLPKNIGQNLTLIADQQSPQELVKYILENL